MKETNTETVIKSDLFSGCKDCQTAVELGLDEISEVLNPSLENQNPPNPLTAVAEIQCERTDGVSDKQISASIEVETDGKFQRLSTNPINCPVV